MAEGSRLSVDVAVVGAGLSGLGAARSIADAGRDVVVLEARNRVGGRLLNETLGEGVTVDVGGQWVGSDHARVQRLAAELGVEIFPQHGGGRNLLDVGGKRRRYRGTIPRSARACSGTSSSPAVASTGWREPWAPSNHGRRSGPPGWMLKPSPSGVSGTCAPRSPAS